MEMETIRKSKANIVISNKLPCPPEIQTFPSVFKVSFTSRYYLKLTWKLLIFNTNKWKMGGNTLVQQN